MGNKEIKQAFISSLFNRDVYTKEVRPGQYRTRCPFCGDSDNQNTGHLYIKADVTDNFPILYHCFKCNEEGRADGELISMLEIDDVNLKSSMISLNKTCDNVKGTKFVDGEKIIQFDYERPEVHDKKKIQYIEERLGKKLTDDDINNMKIVTSLRDYLMFNDIRKTTLDSFACNRLEDHYVGFVSFGSSHILFRDISGKEKFRWIKYPITNKSREARVFYSMASSVDIYTSDKLTINMAEGVMDILSVYKNLGHNNENTMNIAACGKHYQSILSLMTQMGFVGSNIELNIFSDNDLIFNNKKNNKPTTVSWFQKILKMYNHLYGSTNIYYNTISKDVGVPVEQISLKKYRL